MMATGEGERDQRLDRLRKLIRYICPACTSDEAKVRRV